MFEHDTMTLAKLQRDDLPMLLELKHESYEHTHHVTIANNEDQDRWFNSLDHDVHVPKSLCLLAGHASNPKVGIVKITGVDWISRSADLAWDVFKRNRGNGFGKKIVAAGVRYCFDILNLRRLTAEILETNIASQKCALAAGFVEEGRKREAIHKQGSYIDSLVYGVLSSEV